MNISELQQIGKEVYKDKPPAYQHKGDMELLEWHIKAMDRLTKAGRIHYIDSALTETEILSIVILEGFGSSQLIQSPLYDPTKSNALNKALIENLDSALKKFLLMPILYYTPTMAFPDTRIKLEIFSLLRAILLHQR